MASLRTVHPLLRVALAVVFAFMSLTHGTITTLARANPAAPLDAIVWVEHGHHDMHAALDGDRAHRHTAPALSDQRVLCFTLSCFVAIAAPIAPTPCAVMCALGRVGPAPAASVFPFASDAAEPPPRLLA